MGPIKYQVIPIQINHHEDAIYIPLGSISNLNCPYIKVNLRLSLPSHIYVKSTYAQDSHSNEYMIQPVTSQHILYFRYIITSAIHTHLHPLLVSFITVNLPLTQYIQASLRLPLPPNFLSTQSKRPAKNKSTTTSGITDDDERNAYFISNVLSTLSTEYVAQLLRDAILAPSLGMTSDATQEGVSGTKSTLKQGNSHKDDHDSTPTITNMLGMQRSSILATMNQHYTVPRNTAMSQKHRAKIIASNCGYTNGLLSCYCTLAVMNGDEVTDSKNNSLRNIFKWLQYNNQIGSLGDCVQSDEHHKSHGNDDIVKKEEVSCDNHSSSPSTSTTTASSHFNLYSSEVIDLLDSDDSEEYNHDHHLSASPDCLTRPGKLKAHSSSSRVYASNRPGSSDSTQPSPQSNPSHHQPQQQKVFPRLAHPHQADISFEYIVSTSSSIHPSQHATSSMANDDFQCIFIYPQLNSPITREDYERLTNPSGSGGDDNDDGDDIVEVSDDLANPHTSSSSSSPLPSSPPMQSVESLYQPNGVATSTSVPLQLTVYSPVPPTEMTTPETYVKRFQSAIKNTNLYSTKHPITADTTSVSLLDNPTFRAPVASSSSPSQSSSSSLSSSSSSLPPSSSSALDGHSIIIPQLTLNSYDVIPICVYFSQLWSVIQGYGGS